MMAEGQKHLAIRSTYVGTEKNPGTFLYFRRSKEVLGKTSINKPLQAYY